MSFSVLCLGLIALLFGLTLILAGYRFFVTLLPVWGFFVGFYIGAQTIQAILDISFLASITSWVVGFLFGSIFAVLSYLFFVFAVALVSFSLGYGIGAGLMGLVSQTGATRIWLIGIVLGVIFILIVMRFRLQKFVIMIATAAAGTGIIIITFLSLFGNYAALQLLENPIRFVLHNSIWWLLFFFAVVIIGVLLQIQANRNYEIEAVNRLSSGDY